MSHFRLGIHMIKMRWHPTLFCTVVCFSTPALAANDFYGPLRAYAQSPIQSVSHTNYLRSGFSLPSDYIEGYASATIASVWAHTDEYALDYYHNQVEVGGKWQISSRWQWELNYRWVFEADNHLDGLTRKFHDLFSIDQNGRDEVGKGRSYISMPQYGVFEDDFSRETIANNISTYVQYQIFQSKQHGLSLGGSLYYDKVTHGTFKGNSFEQGFQVNYSYLNSDHAIYSMIGMTFRPDDRAMLNLPYRKNTAAISAGYRYSLAENHHMIIEYHWYQGSAAGPDEFADAAKEIKVGYRYLMQNSALELIAIENVGNMDNSTDIAFTIGYRYLFRPGSDS